MIDRITRTPRIVAATLRSRIANACRLILDRPDVSIPKRLRVNYSFSIQKILEGRVGITLEDIAAFEAVTGYPLISIIDTIKTEVVRDSRSIRGVDRHDAAISDALHDELIESGAKWVLGYSGIDKSCFIDWMIPQHLADKHGLSYAKDWYKRFQGRRATELIGGYVLSSCGHIVRVRDYKANKKASVIITSHGFGIRSGDRVFFTLLRSNDIIKNPIPDWALKIARKHKILIEYMDNIEAEAFASAYTTIGDPYVAYMIAKNTQYPDHSNIEKLMKSERIETMVEARTREAMLKVLRDRGMSEDTGEGWIISRHMDMIEKIMETDSIDPRIMKVAQESLSQLSEFLDMRGEREKVTTTQTLQIQSGAGNFMAQQIEQKRQQQIEEAKAIVDEDVD
jgi:hypothetical protein